MDTFYFCVLVLGIAKYSGGVQNPPNVGKCIIFREYRMMAADCKWQSFIEIPQILSKNIEIMVASGNRIRFLTNDSFKEYTSLRFLYLDNNFIGSIEEATFAPLTDLEVLDLSSNGIRHIPGELPYSLRKLYLSENPYLIVVAPLSAAFNLQFLTLSSCNLEELPDIGVLPNLLELNLTGNPLSTINPLQLSSMCRLQTIYLPKSMYKLMHSECECYRLLTWTKERSINLSNFTCKALENPDDSECSTNNTEAIKRFDSCLLVEPRIAMTKYYVLAVVLLLVVVIVFMMICCCRRKKKRKPTPRPNSRSDSSLNQEKKITTLIL